MSVTARIDPKFIVAELLGAGEDLVSEELPYTHDFGFTALSLTASTTPAVSKVYGKTLALSAGAYTLDLTALTRDVLAAVTLSGLKVQAFAIRCPSANTAGVLVADGGTNGYNIFGHSTGEVTVHPGGMVYYYAPEILDDVAAGDKTIDLSSSDVDAAFTVLILAG